MRHCRVRVIVSFAGRWVFMKRSRLFQRVRTGAAPPLNRTGHHGRRQGRARRRTKKTHKQEEAVQGPAKIHKIEVKSLSKRDFSILSLYSNPTHVAPPSSSSVHAS